MRFRPALIAALLTIAPAALHAEVEVSLRGSPAAMEEQNRIAKEAGLSVYRTPAQIRAAADRGELVPLEGDENYELADFVSFPYVNGAVALFVQRLAEQYHAACDQKLVVTSGTRPTNQQPANAHALSVHPMGMAVDLRVSDRAACRTWLEETLLSLESKGLLNATREYNPPHYHLAIFPNQYLAYTDSLAAVERALAAEKERAALAQLAAAAQPLVAPAPTPEEHRSDPRAGIFLAIGAVIVLSGVGAHTIRQSIRR